MWSLNFMALIVQKYGGTSVGTAERLHHVAAKIRQTRAQGHDVVVVVSAMSGETDRLIGLAKSIHEQPEPREYAVLVATGEQVSIALLTMALMAQGCPARSYTGAQAYIRTDSHHKKARILHVNSEILREDLAAGCVPVVAGFQGISANGDVTTLGRGGSDTTAVALAAALNADECQIYTDVDGVYTADPKIVTDAQRLDQISATEMLELASLGTKVVQHRAVEFAEKYRVPLRILSSFQESSGTLINFAEKGMEQPVISGIACQRQEARIILRGMPANSDYMAEILTYFSAAEIEIDMLSQQLVNSNYMDICFTLAQEDLNRALIILDDLVLRINLQEIQHEKKVAKLSLVGVGLRSHPAIISVLFKTLSSHGIHLRQVSTSEIKISAILNENDVENAMQLLHAAYGLNRPIATRQLTQG